MFALIPFSYWYRIFTNPTTDDFLLIGCICSLVILGFLLVLLSDKIDDLNEKKRIKSTVFKPFSVQEKLDNEFMFTIGEHK